MRGDLHGAFAEVIVASQLHFLFAADRDWCQANAMPLLHWDNSERARQAWDGFLFWGRWTDELLEAGLLRDYLVTGRHVEAFGDDMRRRLAEHLAAVSLYSDIDPGTWATTFTRDAPTPLRVEWLNQVAWTLGRLDAEVRQRQWNRWMRDYWANRLDSIPLRLTFEEASALAGWVVHLEDSFEEAVGLAVASPAGLEQHGQLLRELSNHVEHSPTACARLLAHLLAGTNAPFWHCDLVQEIAAKVRGHATEGEMRQIREQSLRLGCTAAAAW